MAHEDFSVVIYVQGEKKKQRATWVKQLGSDVAAVNREHAALTQVLLTHGEQPAQKWKKSKAKPGKSGSNIGYTVYKGDDLYRRITSEGPHNDGDPFDFHVETFGAIAEQMGYKRQ